MLVVGLLQLFGLIVLGFLITPFMFYLIGTIVAVIVLTINLSVRLTRQKSFNSFPKIFKKFLWSPHSIVYHSKESEQEVYPPYYTHSIGVIGKNRGYIPHVPNLKAKHYWKGSPDNRHLDTPNQAVATKLEKVRNVSHRIILFYRSYYGHSTKVEKNQSEACLDIILIGIMKTGKGLPFPYQNKEVVGS